MEIAMRKTALSLLTIVVLLVAMPLTGLAGDDPGIAELREKAEEGVAEAQLNLGYRYADGEGVEQDHVEAVKWYHLAAEQGYAGAQHNLGFCYQNGKGVKQDHAEAAKWYRLAAEQGNAGAQHNLGNAYHAGLGVVKDNAEAVKWWRKAAEQGNAGGQFKVGSQHALGEGVAKDYMAAYMWWSLSAGGGDETAAEMLTHLKRRMSPAQVAEGKRLAREWQEKHQKADDK
jgi:TPR repeat protein